MRFVAPLVLLGCRDSGPTAPVGREFNIAVGQTTVVAGTELTVTFVRVLEDNRCPMGALCIQTIGAGNGQIELKVTAKALAPATLKLNTTMEPKDGVVDVYRIQLTALSPIPQLGKTIREQDYRASLMVSVPSFIYSSHPQ